jgi:lysophospholipase L1-like esterase
VLGAAVSTVLAIAAIGGAAELQARAVEQAGNLRFPTDAPGLKYEYVPGGGENSAGFRERELPGAKPAGELRVACVGDSVTNGALVKDEEAWPRQLERLLPAGFRTLNFGVYGYDTESIRAQLHHRVLAWQPDLVVYGFYVNDLLPTEMVSVGPYSVWVGSAEPPGAWPFARSLRSRSALFRKAEGAAASRALAGRHEVEDGDWGAFAADIRAMKAEGVPLMAIAIAPLDFAAWPDLVACEAASGMSPRFCARNSETIDKALAVFSTEGVPAVDGREAYRGGGDLRGHAADPHHPNAEGHRRLAAALVGPVEAWRP